MNYTIAIGDIHGCYNELLQLMEVIQKETYGKKDKWKFVFLGDYIDRGPDSKKVLDYLIDLDNNQNEEYKIDELSKHIFLMGNHEEMALNDKRCWLSNGGIQTLESFEKNEWGKEFLPFKYSDWIKNLRYFYKDSQRIYVHAGIIRGIEIEEQDSYNMMWIRDKFLNNVSPKGGYVVHGHTPVKQVELRPNRCNLDTSCVFGGVLSAAIFNEEQVEPIMILNHKGKKDVRNS